MLSTNGRHNPSQRVLIVDNHTIMGAGVKKLLSNTGRLQIVNSTPLAETDLIHDVQLFMPDVIILSNRSQLTTPIRLLSLLKNQNAFRLIVVSEDDNTIEVYDKQQIMAERETDLAKAVRAN